MTVDVGYVVPLILLAVMNVVLVVGLLAYCEWRNR